MQRTTLEISTFGSSRLLHLLKNGDDERWKRLRFTLASYFIKTVAMKSPFNLMENQVVQTVVLRRREEKNYEQTISMDYHVVCSM